MQERLKRIQRFGMIPFNSFKEKNRIVNKLRSEIKTQLRISVESSFVFYEYYEFQ